jgi:hypothetical protein
MEIIENEDISIINLELNIKKFSNSLIKGRFIYKISMPLVSNVCISFV